MKKQIISMALIALGAGLTAAEPVVDAKTPNKPVPVTKTAKPKGKKKKIAKAPMKEHWVCPMHDGGESDHPGACPKCGMDLVLDSMSKAEPSK